MDKPGRNDPCYCGSGQKYKKCHMPIDQQKEKERRDWVQAARFLSRDFMLFAREERFAADFAQALSLYWNEMYTIENAEEMSQYEALRFFDWFVLDYALADGSRLIDAYRAHKWDDLSTAQQAVLEKWIAEAGPSWAYTLTDYDADKLYLTDFFYGESFAVEEPGGRGVVEIGEVILARLVPVYDHLEFSTAAAYLPADEIGDLQEKLVQAQTAVTTTDPDVTPPAFMRRFNHLLVHHALAQAEKKNRPPVARLDPNRSDKVLQKVVRQVKRRV